MADAQGCFEEEEVCQFFDAREELSEGNSSNLDFLYQVWIKSPSSIQDRRTMFMKWMGLDQAVRAQPDSVDVDESIAVDCNRLSVDCGAVLRCSESENGSYEIQSTFEDRSADVQFGNRIKSLGDSGLDEIERRVSSCSSSDNCAKMNRSRRIGWLRRLSNLACIADKQDDGVDDSGISDYDQIRLNRFRRVRVRSYRKKSKELSAVYMGQNFAAHNGAILTMKFSPDGEYIASGGEDGIVRVWKVIECRRSNAKNIPVDDPSCIYFNMNDNSELLPLYIDKKKMIKYKSLRRTSDSACVVIPQELFQVSENPLYEFRGHNGDVLDLAWSKDLDLLSSSVDKTVRLWKLGCDKCLKVFPHNNYVTSIQFNPIDERYFISGSIDGNARIWEISSCRVVDWTDVGQIISAVCYRPDGKVVVVGTMMGDCRFYDASDNHLQLDTEITFQGRKKSVDKRITSFQFCPSDQHKLLVTSADSTVRILDGINLVSKFKGLRNAGTQISAMFTSNGHHIVSASEDSHVYVWNHSNQDHIPSSKHVKSSWSSERFTSRHVSVAIPWPGFSSKAELISMPECSLELIDKDYFSLWTDFFSDIAPKGSATWPEEKLPSSIPNPSSLSKSQLKFLKTSWQNISSHCWGQVILTAGSDGRIRSFQNYGLPAS